MAVAGVGFLKQTHDRVRVWVDDPTIFSQFGDSVISDYIRRAYADIFSDLNRTNVFRAVARVNLPVVAGQQNYALPITFGRLISLTKHDANTDLVEAEALPSHNLDPYQLGFVIENQTLRYLTKPTSAETLRLTYVPNGEASIFEATSAANKHDTTTVGSPVVIAGAVSLLPHAYVGYNLRVLTPGASPAVMQDHLITAYDVDTTVDAVTGQQKFTLANAFSPAIPAGNVITFEVTPHSAYRMIDIVSLRVARFLSSATGDSERRDTLNAEYRDALQTLRADLSQNEGRVGIRFRKRVRGRIHYGRTT